MYSMLDLVRGETTSFTPLTTENQNKRSVDKGITQSRSNSVSQSDNPGVRAVDSTSGYKDGEIKDRTTRTGMVSERHSQSKNTFHFVSIVKTAPACEASVRRKPMYEGAEYFQFDTGDHPANRPIPIILHSISISTPSGGEVSLTDNDVLYAPHTSQQCTHSSAVIESHVEVEVEGGQTLGSVGIYDPVQRWSAAQMSCTSFKHRIGDSGESLSSMQGGLKSKSSDALPSGAFPIFSEMHISGRPRTSAMQVRGADRLSRGKSAAHIVTNMVKDVPHTLVHCVSFRADMGGEEEAPVEKKLRAITNEKKQARRREVGWNASHNVLHEEERHLENLKRMDYNRLQRLEQLKLLHLSYDEVKEQRVAREERMKKRKQELIQKERKQYLERMRVSRQACQMLREDEGKCTEEVSAEQPICVTREDSEDGDAAIYLEEQEQLGNEEDDEEKEYDEKGEENDDNNSDEEEEEEEEGEWKVNDPLPSGQLRLHQHACHLKEVEAQRQYLTIHSSEEDNPQIEYIHHINGTENRLEHVQEEEGEGKEERSEGRQGNKRGLISRGGREEMVKGFGEKEEELVSHTKEELHQNLNLNLTEIEEKEYGEENKEEEEGQDKGNEEKGGVEEKTEGENNAENNGEGEDSMDDSTPLGHDIFKPRERRTSFPIGAFRPQSAAYLRAQRGLVSNGSLETSMSEEESKDSFDSSTLTGPQSKSPSALAGVALAPYYLGESDSFADFHPRPTGAMISHPLVTNDQLLEQVRDAEHSNDKAVKENLALLPLKIES